MPIPLPFFIIKVAHARHWTKTPGAAAERVPRDAGRITAIPQVGGLHHRRSEAPPDQAATYELLPACYGSDSCLRSEWNVYRSGAGCHLALSDALRNEDSCECIFHPR